jgi:hypothetical protein
VRSAELLSRFGELLPCLMPIHPASISASLYLDPAAVGLGGRLCENYGQDCGIHLPRTGLRARKPSLTFVHGATVGFACKALLVQSCPKMHLAGIEDVVHTLIILTVEQPAPPGHLWGDRGSGQELPRCLGAHPHPLPGKRTSRPPKRRSTVPTPSYAVPSGRVHAQLKPGASCASFAAARGGQGISPRPSMSFRPARPENEKAQCRSYAVPYRTRKATLRPLLSRAIRSARTATLTAGMRSRLPDARSR